MMSWSLLIIHIILKTDVMCSFCEIVQWLLVNGDIHIIWLVFLIFLQG